MSFAGLVVNYTPEHLAHIRISRMPCIRQSIVGSEYAVVPGKRAAKADPCGSWRSLSAGGLCQNRHGAGRIPSGIYAQLAANRFPKRPETAIASDSPLALTPQTRKVLVIADLEAITLQKHE